MHQNSETTLYSALYQVGCYHTKVKRACQQKYYIISIVYIILSHFTPFDTNLNHLTGKYEIGVMEYWSNGGLDKKGYTVQGIGRRVDGGKKGGRG
jgi:hypothetical protein